LSADEVRWHSHGILQPLPGATTLIADAHASLRAGGAGEALLYLDQQTSDGTRPLLRAILNRFAERVAGQAAFA
jgi:hypothetical protein